MRRSERSSLSKGRYVPDHGSLNAFGEYTVEEIPHRGATLGRTALFMLTSRSTVSQPQIRSGGLPHAGGTSEVSAVAYVRGRETYVSFPGC